MYPRRLRQSEQIHVFGGAKPVRFVSGGTKPVTDGKVRTEDGE